MTTRLSQKRVKGGDPSYPTLQDELQARILGEGKGGYAVPVGGIPKADLSQHLQDLLTALESSTIIATTGVALSDLSQELEDAFNKTKESYVKPIDGIPVSDLTADLQDILLQFKDYYVYPSTGIPKVDLDSSVKHSLELADSAYQKPSMGIHELDLSKEVVEKIETGLSRYELPEGGIPSEHLAEDYVTQDEYQKAVDHIADDSVHITDHDKLINIGMYNHRDIDEKLDSASKQLSDIWGEIVTARDEFSTIGNRINSLLGLNAFHSVVKKNEWERGTFKNLRVNKEGFVGLTYNSEQPSMDLYAVEVNGAMNESNNIGKLLFHSDSRVFLGSKPWQEGTNRLNNVGVKLDTFLYVDVTGTYEFATQFSGRVRLTLGDRLLYDTQSLYGQVDAYTRTNTITLEAGRLYRVLLEGWYGNEGDRVVGLSWKRPGAHSFIEIDPVYFNNSGYLHKEGIYESEVIDIKDNNIAKWTFELNATENRSKDDIIVQIRTSDNASNWLDWMEIEDSGVIPITAQRYVQVRITVRQNYPFYSPVVSGYRIRFISSTNNEIMNELSLARDSHATIKDRFVNIESMMQQLSKFVELQNRELFHPEFFASVRLASQELGLLKLALYESDRQKAHITLDNGVADRLWDTNFIDENLSDRYEIIDRKVRALKSLTRLEGNAEWSKWELDNMDYVNGVLRLDYSATAPISSTTGFGNWYQWSTRDTARLAGNYQAYIAQPYYTSADVNLITRLQIATYDAYYHPQHTIMICESQVGKNLPNVANPIWAVTTWTYNTINFPNLRVPVKPNTKYWIVIKREELQRYDGYSRFWLSYNNTSTNARLRGTNPENAYLYLWYTSDGEGKQGWAQDSGYFLTFHIDEAKAFAPSGEATRIIDYNEGVRMVDASITQTVPEPGLTSITYQTSSDMHNWSKEETNVDQLPNGRFLKIKVKMNKSSTTAGSPTISKIDLLHLLDYSDVITKPMESQSIPTHALFSAKHGEGITFFISRDDGVTWKQLKKDEFTQLDDIMPGHSVRFKMRFDGRLIDSTVDEYAFMFTSYRDITQQNVTALYEEYIAEESQTVFKLKDKYVMGNHSLQVYLNGIRQSLLKDYQEVDRYTVQFNDPLIGGLDADRVTFIVSTGAYDQHDAVMHQKIEEAQERARELHVPHTKEHIYNEAGLLISTVFNPQYYVQRYDYEYNENGRKVKETKTTKTYVEIIEYNYNEEGFLINESVKISEVKG